MRLHPGHGARLLALPYELARATIWTHEANGMTGPAVGLPELPVIEWPELFARDPDGLYGKTRTVVAGAAGRPFVWVDDMVTGLDVRAPVAEHHDGPALVLPVDARHGLRAREFAELERWAHSL